MAGGACLAIAFAHAYAAAVTPSPQVPPAVGWTSEPVLPPLTVGWHPVESEVAEDEPIDGASVPPPDAYDGVYVGSATSREGGRTVTYRITVRYGIGTGTQSRLDCGAAPLSLRLSPLGDVSGIATVFGLTCLKTDVAVRGRAIAGLLQLRLGTQYLELAKP
jgi:hypothetical protein